MHYRPIKAIILILSITLIVHPVNTLELLLNQRHIALYTSQMLLSHTYSDPISKDFPTLHLSNFFPWMEEVDAIVLRSGRTQQRWNSDQLSNGKWNEIKLIHNSDRWELRVGQDAFMEPMQIAVFGKILETPVLNIWYAVENDFLMRELTALLKMRSLDIKWRKISQPSRWLARTQRSALPHLILLEDYNLMPSLPLYADYQPIVRAPSRWISTAHSDNKNNSQSLAMDLRDAETSLYWLLGENQELKRRLTSILDRSIAYPNEIIDTVTPLLLLESGQATTAPQPSRFDGSRVDPAIPIQSINPPFDGVNIFRIIFAAIPAKLSETDARIATMILRDTARLSRLAADYQAEAIPLDSLVSRFFTAYQRIAPIALSGQMEATHAADLIEHYVYKR